MKYLPKMQFNQLTELKEKKISKSSKEGKIVTNWLESHWVATDHCHTYCINLRTGGGSRDSPRALADLLTSHRAANGRAENANPALPPTPSVTKCLQYYGTHTERCRSKMVLLCSISFKYQAEIGKNKASMGLPITFQIKKYIYVG